MTIMKKTLLVAGGVALLVGSAAAQTAEEAAVVALVDRMMTAFAEGDVPGVLATYRPQAVVVGAPGSKMQGEAALAAMFQNFVDAGFAFAPGEHEVIVAGDTALHLMGWTGQGPDGSPFRALSVAVLTRDAAGDWRMVIDHPFGDGLMHRP
jgi:uncharacterized protein (TIGR02246 family)